MSTLYVIGNGFDLHFELNTKTKDFKKYLEAEPVYNEVENALEVLMEYDVDWNEYEQALNNINLDEIMSQNEVFPDYMSDHESDRDGGILNMQMYLESINEAIESALRKMVKAANRDARGKKEEKELFIKGDAVLSFNYTSTLEYLFPNPDKIPIFHIHGCYEEGTPLIFGYRSDEHSYISSWASMNEEDWDYYIAQQRIEAFDFYERWRKKLQLKKLRSFLKECKGIDSIVVLGHSMSAVDHEYMEEIEEMLHPERWKISYYEKAEEEDKEKIRAQKYSFENKIEFITISQILNKSSNKK